MGTTLTIPAPQVLPRPAVPHDEAVDIDMVSSSPAPARRRLRAWAGILNSRVLVLALAYFLSAKVGLMLAHGWIASPVWPPAGVAVAGLLLFGRRSWPGVALGSFLIGLPQGVVTDLGTMVAQTLGPLVAATVLEARHFNRSLARVADVLHLLVVGGASMLVSASVATGVLALADVIGPQEWVRAWLTWWLGDAMGVILVTPLVLVVTAPNTIRRRWRETAALLLTTAISTRLLFAGDLPLVFLVFPFALWAALRLGPPGAAAVSALVSAIAIWTTAQGRGAFSGLPDASSLVVLEAFNAGVAVTSLVLAAAVATTVRLTLENERLHAEVRAQLHEVLASRARIVQAAYGERRRMERDLHDGA
ncbi:MAG: MASE1 domain-containing protein, partial [Acidimicrobiia bacterium]